MYIPNIRRVGVFTPLPFLIPSHVDREAALVGVREVREDMEEKAITLARELQMERDRVDDLYSKEDRDIKALARECER